MDYGGKIINGDVKTFVGKMEARRLCVLNRVKLEILGLSFNSTEFCQDVGAKCIYFLLEGLQFMFNYFLSVFGSAHFELPTHLDSL